MRLEYLVLAATLVAGPVVALLGAPPQGNGPWVMVAPPWRDPEALAERAQTRLIGPVQAPFGFLVAASGPAGGAFAVERLHRAGAWLVLDANAWAQFCGVE